MNSPTITQENVKLNLADEVATFTLRIGMVACGAIGIFGVTCLVSALIGQGPLAMIRRYVEAVGGF